MSSDAAPRRHAEAAARAPHPQLRAARGPHHRAQKRALRPSTGRATGSNTRARRATSTGLRPRGAERVVEIGFGNGEQLAFAARRRTRSATTSASRCTGPASAGCSTAGRGRAGQRAHLPARRGRGAGARRSPTARWPRCASTSPIPGTRSATTSGAWSSRRSSRCCCASSSPAAACIWPPTGRTMPSRCGRSRRGAAAGEHRRTARSVPRPDWRRQTHFERRGLKLGHGVWDLVYTRR